MNPRKFAGSTPNTAWGLRPEAREVRATRRHERNTAGSQLALELIQISETLTIGRHAWRLVQCRGSESRYTVDKTTGIGGLVEMPAIFVDYEWRRLDERFEHWRQARDWPRYDFNDGQHHGLPRRLAQAPRRVPMGPPAPRRRHRHTGVAGRIAEGEGPTGAAR